jgi:hypothetical protein
LRTPTRFESSPTMIERGWRLIRITESIPEISGPVATYAGAVTSLEGLHNAWKLSRRSASVALGRQHEAEAALDEEIRGLALTICKVARGRRDSLAIHTYFPNGYGSGLRLGVEKALQISAGLVAQLADETHPELRARQEPLEAARARLVEVANSRQAAAEARSQAKAILEDGKVACRQAILDFYFAVRSRFPDRRQWVEAIFASPNQGRTEEEPPSDGGNVVNTGEAAEATATAAVGGGSMD